MMKSIRGLIIEPVTLLRVVPAACRAARDTSTLPASLRGHWINENGNTHYHFDGAVAEMVDRDDRTDMAHAILLANESDSSIRIEVDGLTEPSFEDNQRNWLGDSAPPNAQG
jgi:hypothetical protein